MTTDPKDICLHCGHESAEHLGQCYTDLFSSGSWRKCACELFADDPGLVQVG
ncbi:hypothetical protein QFZ29_000043 [Agromyces albus]|nr:hypothetical protein [Agromyces albus]